MNDKMTKEVSEDAPPPPPLNWKVVDPVKVPPANVPPPKFPPPKRENVTGGNSVYTINAFAAFNNPPNKEIPRSFLPESLRFSDASKEPSTKLANIRGITIGVVGIAVTP